MRDERRRGTGDGICEMADMRQETKDKRQEMRERSRGTGDGIWEPVDKGLVVGCVGERSGV